jgi:hypothetical protein
MAVELDRYGSKSIFNSATAWWWNDMPRGEPNGAVRIVRPPDTKEIDMSDSEGQQQSSDQHQKDAQGAESKASTQQLPGEEIGDAADSSSVQADDDDSIEAELEGKNSSNGNEVA